ncbi:Protein STRICTOSIDINE SYNTHASE-LIKE 12 [Camellia lanceoleosa]|uniref:Protein STRICTOSIDINE SYNTHASE-LIKE 12 n=1 Tax=Camellia lanceoleosa TaxID=1840588 RepID=A0ACC0FA12_9ERIC|nr:Protein STRICTOSIDINE SYNTHASE-LIKE 12 [Camellia lanceoleosa]
MASKLFNFILLSSLAFVVLWADGVPFSSFTKIQLPPKARGPDSVPLDLLELGPYVSVADGLATQIATSAEGVDFHLLIGVDVYPITETVYFTDASTTFELRNITQPGFKGDSKGRLMKYDPKTKQVTVLLRGLAGVAGPAVSTDQSFVLVLEFLGKRVRKYWLTGPKANTDEIVINLPGNPSKIRRSASKGFWVAENVISQQPTPLTVARGLRIDGNGMVLETLSFVDQYFNTSITVVQEQRDALCVGSRFVDFVGVFKR